MTMRRLDTRSGCAPGCGGRGASRTDRGYGRMEGLDPEFSALWISRRERGVVTDKPTFSSHTVPASTASDKSTAAFKPAGYERVLTRV